MKALAHIPTEQYGFIEQELEAESNEGIKMAYNSIKRVWSDDFGLDPKEYQAWLINQLLGEGNGVEDMERMSQEQRFYSHEIKKALATIKRRNEQ